jgi:hypothetical protein
MVDCPPEAKNVKEGNEVGQKKNSEALKERLILDILESA